MCALMGFAATPARAGAPQRASLDYTAPTACPTRAQLGASIAGELGYDPFRGAPDVAVDVHIHVEGHRLVARVSIAEGDGHAATRSVSTGVGDCDELVASVALAVAIALDPLAGLVIPAANTVDVAALANDTGARELAIDWSGLPPPLAPRPEDTDAAAPPIELAIGAGILAGTGLSPSATQGVLITAAARRGALSIGAELRLDRAGETAVAGGRVTARLAAVSVLACGHTGRLAACALGSFGGISGGGDGLDEDRSGTAPYLGAGARVAVEHALGDRVSARLHADVTRTLGSIGLEVDGMEVWSTDPWAATIGLAAIARFP